MYINMLRSALVASGVLLALQVQAKSDQVTIRFPVEYAADISQGKANQDFIRRVQEASQGRIKVRFAPDGAMYKGNELVQAHLRGDVEMTTLVPAYWASIATNVQLFDLPFAFPDYETFDRVAANKEFVVQVYQQAHDKGIKVLGLLANSYALPGTRSTPLLTPGDFSGLKLRAIGKMNATTLQALGANAVSINLVEVPAALQQGLVDGIQTLADAYIQYKFQDQIKHISNVRYQFIYYPWTVNAKWFDGLSSEDQQMIQDAVDEAIAANREVTLAQVEQSLAQLKAQGVQVHEFNEDQRQAWVTQTESVWTQAESTLGHELVEQFRRVRSRAIE